MNAPCPDLRQIFYVSRVSPGVLDADIAAILSESRMRNRRRDITGALTVTGAYFGQFIEGRPAEVEHLLDALGRDTRHVDVRVRVDRLSGQRAFPRWSMGFAYRLALSEHLERLFDTSTPAEAADLEMLFRLGPGSMMGAHA